MSESEYLRLREEIDRTYPQSGGRGLNVNINALRDQELAKLANHSGWTQERLAEVEGCSQPQMSYRLRFGRFLDFITSGDKSEKHPDLWLHDITERKFRGYWEQTEKKDERLRFRDVAALIRENTRIVSTLPKGFSPSMVSKAFGDSKWHSLEVIAKKFDFDISKPQLRKAMLKTMSNGKERNAGGYKWDHRPYGNTTQYRFLKMAGKKIDTGLLQTEIAPILKQLKAEGKKNAATASPATVAHLAHELEQLIRKLAQ